jgi:hypothetical protein
VLQDEAGDPAGQAGGEEPVSHAVDRTQPRAGDRGGEGRAMRERPERIRGAVDDQRRRRDRTPATSASTSSSGQPIPWVDVPMTSSTAGSSGSPNRSVHNRSPAEVTNASMEFMAST